MTPSIYASIPALQLCHFSFVVAVHLRGTRTVWLCYRYAYFSSATSAPPPTCVFSTYAHISSHQLCHPLHRCAPSSLTPTSALPPTCTPRPCHHHMPSPVTYTSALLVCLWNTVGAKLTHPLDRSVVARNSQNAFDGEEFQHRDIHSQSLKLRSQPACPTWNFVLVATSAAF